MPAEQHPSPSNNPGPSVPSHSPKPISPLELQAHIADLPPPVTARGWDVRPRTGASDFWALLGCNAIVFVASVCIMVLELTASRLIATYLGNSLYTWTSVIGVVLAGISVGNYIGGWLADRFAPQKVLGWLFLIAGLSTFAVLFLNNWASSVPQPDGIHLQWWVMLVVAWVFLPPALALGTISPVTASMALKRSAKTGMTVGNIYAWGAMGSIVGTFLAGFWLIGEFGLRQIVWMTSSVLLGMGAIVAGGQWAFRALVLFGALQFVIVFGIYSSTTGDEMANLCRGIAGIRSYWSTTDADFARDTEEIDRATQQNDGPALAAAQERNRWRWERQSAENGWADWGEQLGKELHALGLRLGLRWDDPLRFSYYDESDYYTISIASATEGGDSIKQLRLDYLLHSYFNPENPTKLYYDYERVYAALTERASETWNRETTVALAAAPAERFSDMLPPGIRWNPEKHELTLRGAMTQEQLHDLLVLGTDGEFREAVLSAQSQASGDWKRATAGVGVILTPLPEMPVHIQIPDELATRLHYDSTLKSLVCTSRLSLDDVLPVLAQGPLAAYVSAVADLWHKSRRTSTLFIGGGGFVFPRWIETTFPGESRIDVAEIDPAVLTAVQQALDLPTEYGPPSEGKTWVRAQIGDARKYVDQRLAENARALADSQPAATYDFVYGDAFNDLSVPWHLTTAEFSTKVRDLLTPGEGVYMVNIIDIYPRVKSPFSSARQKDTENDAAQGPSRTLLKGPISPVLFPEAPNDWVWTSAAGEFSPLQIYTSGDSGHQYGYRGVMSDELRDKLLALPGVDDAFRSAVQELYRESRQERVGQFLGRYVRTAREIFPYVYVFTSNEGEPGSSRDTFIVACSLKALDTDQLEAAGGHWRQGPFAWTESTADGTRTDQGEMLAILELSRGYRLEDDFAPVDNLLAPVFVNRSGD